jgi:anti-sigma B factor antagonist
MDNEIETRSDVRDGVLVLGIVTTRLDAANTPVFRKVLINKIDEGYNQIVLDLGDVEFIDSSALGALIAAVKRMGAIGTIALARPNSTVARLLSLTRMDKVFPITATVQEAVTQLAG